MSETAADGRIARGQRTREAVIEALYDLYTEGNLTPTFQVLATRVGVTTRSIYHHFPDREAVAAALAEQQMERHPQLFAARRIRGTPSERVDGIVAHRAQTRLKNSFHPIIMLNAADNTTRARGPGYTTCELASSTPRAE